MKINKVKTQTLLKEVDNSIIRAYQDNLFNKKKGNFQPLAKSSSSVGKRINKSPEPADSVLSYGEGCKGKPVPVKDTANSHSGPYKLVKK